MTSARSLQSKQQIRQQIRQSRRALSPLEKRQAAQALLHTLRQFSHFQYSQHIAIYLTNDSEIDTQYLIKDLQQRGKQLYLPVIHPMKSGQLVFVRWTSSTRMIKNRYGILEPEFAPSKVMPAAFIQLICLPLVAFDEQGSRLGMGGGYYDRTLAFIKNSMQSPALIGLAYEVQKVEALPHEPWDIPLTAIATEKRLYQFEC